MIPREKNPEYLNSFLDYSITILNKSPNSVKEYNYDLTNFLKFMMIRFKLTKTDNYDVLDITSFSEQDLNRITLDDIHAYVSHLAINNRSKATTRARKISTIRIFFKYLTQKANILKVNPAQNLETPKLEKRMPKYLSLDDSKKLLDAADNQDNRNYKRDCRYKALRNGGKSSGRNEYERFQRRKLRHSIEYGTFLSFDKRRR